MRDLIIFFQQYESLIYFFLALGIIYYSWRFYSAWQEMKGSVFGLEQVNAQQRLNRSALAIFSMLVMGAAVFSLIAFVLPIVDTDVVDDLFAPFGAEETLMEANLTGTTEPSGSDEILASATPLPTVAVDPSMCKEGVIEITSPSPNSEVRGEVEITGVVNVVDFGFYVIEYARADIELWNPITSSRALVPEESVLLEWDTSFSPPGSYVIQLVVSKNDGSEYDPCRIPIRIGNQ